MIVDGMKRGYEDFRVGSSNLPLKREIMRADMIQLLHGPLSNLMPPSTSTSSALERFWTKFAFQFESTYLSPTEPGDLLQTWLGGYKAATSEPIDALAVLDGIDAESGLIKREGPISRSTSTSAERPLLRFLVHQLHLALPPSPTPPPPPATTHNDRSTLGLGFGLGGRRKKAPSTLAPEVEDKARSTSWTAWVPGMSAIGAGNEFKADKEAPTEGGAGRWPSLGLGGMGAMFGLGKSSTTETGQTQKETSNRQFVEVEVDRTQAHQVEQSEVVLPDLQEAVQPEDEIQLSWDKKDVWLLDGDGQFGKRRVTWIIVSPHHHRSRMSLETEDGASGTKVYYTSYILSGFGRHTLFLPHQPLLRSLLPLQLDNLALQSSLHDPVPRHTSETVGFIVVTASSRSINQ